MPTEEDRVRLAEIVEYTRHDLARRDAAADVVPGGAQHVHIHHHYAPPPAPVPVPEMDIASRYAGHFVLAVWAMIAMAGVAVVFVMIAQALMIAMISLAICALAFAAMIKSLRYSKIDKQLADQRSRGRTRK
jgi:hypothetical protein